MEGEASAGCESAAAAGGRRRRQPVGQLRIELGMSGAATQTSQPAYPHANEALEQLTRAGGVAAEGRAGAARSPAEGSGSRKLAMLRGALPATPASGQKSSTPPGRECSKGTPGGPWWFLDGLIALPSELMGVGGHAGRLQSRFWRFSWAGLVAAGPPAGARGCARMTACVPPTSQKHAGSGLESRRRQWRPSLPLPLQHASPHAAGRHGVAGQGPRRHEDALPRLHAAARLTPASAASAGFQP